MSQSIFKIFFIIILSLQFLIAKADDILNYPVTDFSDSHLQAVQKMLSTPKIIEGNFIQQRKITILSEPLESSGTFVLSKEKGLTWKQTKPFISTMIVTSNKIQQQVMDNPPTIMTEKEQPAVFNFTKVFLNVFQGRVLEVQDYFNLYFKGDRSHWEMMLLPKGAPLNKALKSIDLEGDQYINKVIVVDVQGNTLLITFSNIKTTME